MDVKPWEPVRYDWQFKHNNFASRRSHVLKWEKAEWDTFASGNSAKKLLGADQMSVILSNGQRIIVRALSDERKAARAAMKEAVS